MNLVLIAGIVLVVLVIAAALLTDAVVQLVIPAPLIESYPKAVQLPESVFGDVRLLRV